MTIDGQIRSDVPRNSQVTALIGDPRNDENLIVSQLHLSVVRFHNHVVGDVRNQLGPLATTAEVFVEAQRVVRWHYQWMILHEFLPLTRGEDGGIDSDRGTPALRLAQRPLHPGGSGRVPVRSLPGSAELSRQLRDVGTDPAQQFFADLQSRSERSTDPADFRGGCRAPRRFIDWQTFFDFGDGRVRRNKRIDTTLSSVLFHLLGQPSNEPDTLATAT